MQEMEEFVEPDIPGTCMRYATVSLGCRYGAAAITCAPDGKNIAQKNEKGN
jgi:hypothetical protein